MADEPTPTPAPEPTPEPTPTPDKTFTQADVDRIVQERVARVKTAPPADYDDLKAKAAKLDEIEQANQSELEKANARAAKAEADAQAVVERAQKQLTDAAILAAAAGKFADPSDAVHLVERGSIEYGADGTPSNVADLVGALLESKPHLAATRTGSADLGAREGNGANQITREQLRTMSPEEVVKADAEGRLEAIKTGKQ